MKLAIIPARGGSQRIPRKNIRPFAGKPIIAYSIQAALESKCFDEVMVSTDDKEIASVAESFGASVPFMRSAQTATHTATTADVLSEVLNKYKERSGMPTEFCCIYPTAPFVTADILKKGFAMLISTPTANGVISIVKYSYPIQRALKIKDKTISMFQPEHQSSRSQDLESAYHDAGQFYWCKTPAFLSSKNLMGPGTLGLVLPESQVQDIDTEEDWAMAELKFKQMTAKS